MSNAPLTVRLPDAPPASGTRVAVNVPMIRVAVMLDTVTVPEPPAPWEFQVAIRLPGAPLTCTDRTGVAALSV